jgi:hypothetical protein
MSTLKTNHAIALGLAAAIAVIGTSAAWARSNPHIRGVIVEERGQKTYLPGEGGCKDEMLHWRQPCGE